MTDDEYRRQLEDTIAYVPNVKNYMKKKTPTKKKKKIVGFTCGAFDLTHAGHYMMFKECKKLCDTLIVGLQIDPSLDRPEKHKPIQTIEERLEQLDACKYIDKIILYRREKDLYELLKHLNPNVRFLGEDHKGKPFTGDDLEIPIVWNSRNHNYSSSSIRERIKNDKR